VSTNNSFSSSSGLSSNGNKLSSSSNISDYSSSSENGVSSNNGSSSSSDSSSSTTSSSSNMVSSSSSNGKSSSSVPKCNGKEYNPEMQFCSNSNIYDKCGGNNYSPASEGCCNNVRYNLSYLDKDLSVKNHECCDNKMIYTIETQSCIDNTVLTKCNSKDYYNPTTQFCLNDKVYHKDVISKYKTVIIGTQTWMAENLNFDGGDGSIGKCYGNDPANCNIYGRLYDWATTVGLPIKCNNNGGGSQEGCNIYYNDYVVGYPRPLKQGICPNDWHIPDENEWQTLIKFIEDENKYNYAGKYLKTTYGWNDGERRSGNGTDGYGFSALPGGYGNPFAAILEDGKWWTSFDDYNNNIPQAFHFYLYVEDPAGLRMIGKNKLLSVRCIKN
jgi:uncharacterized protein (TIGR02145 family)